MTGWPNSMQDIPEHLHPYWCFRFKPKVLTLVSHNGKWFVGSSVAVNHFLRPLGLYNRICDFKQSLKKAVIYYQPLETEDNLHWKSSSFWFKPLGYTTCVRFFCSSTPSPMACRQTSKRCSSILALMKVIEASPDFSGYLTLRIRKASSKCTASLLSCLALPALFSC